MRNLLLLILSSVFLASAEPMRFGVKAGAVPHDLVAAGTDESLHFTVGPMFEFKLVRQVVLEVDLLYKRPAATQSNFRSGSASIIRGHSLELPILGKYYFRGASSWRPFGSGGIAIRQIWYSVERTPPTFPLAGITAGRYNQTSGLHAGAVAGGGVEWRPGRFSIAPEIRYTYWGDLANGSPSTRHRGEVLVGVSF